jgi:hypothetical protein
VKTLIIAITASDTLYKAGAAIDANIVTNIMATRATSIGRPKRSMKFVIAAIYYTFLATVVTGWSLAKR